MKGKVRKVSADRYEWEDQSDPDRLVLSGTGSHRVSGLPEELDNLLGVFVQGSRSFTRDVTLSPLYAPDAPAELKSECKDEEHDGERVLPVSKFSPDPSRPNGYDRYCKQCRSRRAARRRGLKKHRSTTSVPSAPLTK